MCLSVCSRGDFNLSVVMSPLWSSLCGVAICSVARSSTRQRFLRLPLYFCHLLPLFSYLQHLLDITLFFSRSFSVPFLGLFRQQCRCPFFPLFLYLSLSILRSGSNKEKDRKNSDLEQNTQTHTHIHTHLSSPAGRQTDRRTDRQGPNYPCCMEHEISK